MVHSKVGLCLYLAISSGVLVGCGGDGKSSPSSSSASSSSEVVVSSVSSDSSSLASVSESSVSSTDGGTVSSSSSSVDGGVSSSSAPSSDAPASSAPASSAAPIIVDTPSSSSVASSVAISSEASFSSEMASSVSSEASSEASSSSEVASSSSSEVSSSSEMASSVSSVASSEVNSSSEVASSSSAASSSAGVAILTNDFEQDALGSTYGVIGWGNPGTTATVIAALSISGLPANGDSINILRVTSGEYNAGPKFSVVLPAGKTLADYLVKVDVYLPVSSLGLVDEWDNFYKDFIFMADTTITGALSIDNPLYHSKFSTEWNHGDAWLTFTFTPNATKAAELTGELEIALGLSRPAGDESDAYYLDNIRLELAP